MTSFYSKPYHFALPSPSVNYETKWQKPFLTPSLAKGSFNKLSYHFALPSPSVYHAKSAIRLARWARIKGFRAMSFRFLNDAAEYRRWLT